MGDNRPAMNTQARAHLKQLLEGQRVLSVAVVIDGEAQIGLLPFSVLPEHTGVVVHVSTLARHTQGLLSGESIAVLIHQSEEAVTDPLQVPRLSMKATAVELQRGSRTYEQAKSRFLTRFPDAAITFELADFRLLELHFLEGRYVEGFAKAMDIRPEDLQSMAPPEEPKTNIDEAPTLRRRWRANDD